MVAISGIPNEILSAIFTEGALVPVPPPTQSYRPMRQFTQCGSQPIWNPNTFWPSGFAATVSLVSRLWRDIALATPTLWSKIVFRDVNLDFRVSKNLYMRSNGVHPVDLAIDIDDWELASVAHAMELVITAMSHSRSLVVNAQRSLRTDFSFTAHAMILDALQTCAHAPLLEHLDLDGIWVQDTKSWTLFSGRQLPRLQIFRIPYPPQSIGSSLSQASQSLHALEFKGKIPFSHDLSLPSLCAISFLRSRNTHEAMIEFLKHVHMPSLRSMKLLAILPAISAFLGLSATSDSRAFQVISGLTDFTVDSKIELRQDQADEMFSLLPNVHVLEIGHHDSFGRNESFILALMVRPDAISTPPRCPKLEHLIISGRQVDGMLVRVVQHVVTSRTEANIPLIRVTLRPPDNAADEEDWQELEKHVHVVRNPELVHARR